MVLQVFVGANSFAQNTLIVQMNSHLQYTQLCFLGSIRASQHLKKTTDFLARHLPRSFKLRVGFGVLRIQTDTP
jgi:hypothetical protein